jgi:ribosomal protein S13
MVNIGFGRWILAAIIIISFIVGAIFILPNMNIVIIAATGECEFPEGVCNFGKMLGFPIGWLRLDTFLWYALLPLFGVWMIIYGFLTVINIFGRGRTGFYALLSFCIAFSTIPLGYFVIFVSLLFAFMGTWSTIIFAILFIGGTIFFLLKKFTGWGAERAGDIMYKKQIDAYKRQTDLYEKQEREAVERLNKLSDEIASGKSRLTSTEVIKREAELTAQRNEARRGLASCKEMAKKLNIDKKEYDKEMAEQEKLIKEAEKG